VKSKAQEVQEQALRDWITKTLPQLTESQRMNFWRIHASAPGYHEGVIPASMLPGAVNLIQRTLDSNAAR
jgi:hypothetical protein